MLHARRQVRRVVVGSALVAALVLAVAIFTTAAGAQTGEPSGQAVGYADSAGWAFLGAALSVGLGCLGAGIAVAYVGAAAVGAMAEKPELAARTLIFVGLAEGIAIYGLIIAIMILGKLP